MRDQRFTKEYAIGGLTFPGIIPLLHLLESSCGQMLMDVDAHPVDVLLVKSPTRGHMAELRRQSSWLVKKNSSIWWWIIHGLYSELHHHLATHYCYW
jgi:hypothetical protein